MIGRGLINRAVATFIAGMAIGQFIYGPASDRFGRRAPILVGIVIFIIASIASEDSIASICSLFQLGITLIGASTTAILSTLEPITSVVLGVIILSEQISAVKLAGCALIFAGVVLVTTAQMKEQGRASRQPPPME